MKKVDDNGSLLHSFFKKLLALLSELIFLHHYSRIPSGAEPRAAFCKSFPSCIYMFFLCGGGGNFLVCELVEIHRRKRGDNFLEVGQLIHHGWHCPIMLGLISYLK